MLALLVLIAMILGVVIGVYAPNVQQAFSGAELAGTSVRESSLPLLSRWTDLTLSQPWSSE